MGAIPQVVRAETASGVQRIRASGMRFEERHYLVAQLKSAPALNTISIPHKCILWSLLSVIHFFHFFYSLSLVFCHRVSNELHS
jgi:hypothetical protein